MGKHLIIAEKPSVAKDIALSLGGFGRVENWLESPEAVITAAQGHLVEVFSSEMATSGKSLETLPVIPSKFELRVIELANKPQAFQQIKRLMARNDIDRIVNACDSGREGELIFRLIYDLAECKKPVMRMWFNSMTSEAIRDAYRGMLPGSRFDALADAAYCRTEGDYLVGINGSRGVTRLYERQTSKAEIRSVGRVQTPTGALVYDREVAIRTFKAKDYWEVHGEFGVAAGSYIGKWIAPERDIPADAPEGSSDGQAEVDHQYRIFEQGRAEAILARCAGVAPSDVKQESKPATKGSPKLYDLTLLQREANKKLGLTSKQTDTIAQALYEKHKVTTYPRTDSCFLPEDYIAKAKSVVEALVETRYRDHATRILSNGWVKPDKRIFDNSKISDHFAIIPTGKLPEGLSPDEEKVYDLVVKRFLSIFHPAAQYEVTTRLTIVAGEHFKSSGRVLVHPGWLAVYGTQTQDDDKKIPALTKYVPGESVSTEGMELKTLKTKPPVRYTEDTLLGAMEGAGKLVDDEELREAMKERGLGAPSTRSAIIEGLLATKDGRDRPMEPVIIFRPLTKTQEFAELGGLPNFGSRMVISKPIYTHNPGIRDAEALRELVRRAFGEDVAHSIYISGRQETKTEARAREQKVETADGKPEGLEPMAPTSLAAVPAESSAALKPSMAEQEPAPAVLSRVITENQSPPAPMEPPTNDVATEHVDADDVPSLEDIAALESEIASPETGGSADEADPFSGLLPSSPDAGSNEGASVFDGDDFADFPAAPEPVASIDISAPGHRMPEGEERPLIADRPGVAIPDKDRQNAMKRRTAEETKEALAAFDNLAPPTFAARTSKRASSREISDDALSNVLALISDNKLPVCGRMNGHAYVLVSDIANVAPTLDVEQLVKARGLPTAEPAAGKKMVGIPE